MASLQALPYIIRYDRVTKIKTQECPTSETAEH